jgi:amino acid adenylation domain-containing protein/non-ribosomal peptide synthase protein (TIGR01720 family)
MACRFPGAKNIEEYWDNLKNGVESVTFLSDEELRQTGVEEATINDPNYVKAAFVIDGVDGFDANFFGYSPKEAAMIDPQQRLFLELAWLALEQAGYATEEALGPIGVFGGTSFNTYFINNLMAGRRLVSNSEAFFLQTSNDKDNLTTRTSYKLNLKGPSVSVQTACSTSLVAIHYAVQSLLNYECEMALAGGVSVKVPQRAGYFYADEMILSSDGHCRPFDEQASGTVFGSGAGIVLLKRLEDAIKDNDNIIAVIKGTAINNDGSDKVGYTAPSIKGQVEVINNALAISGVEIDSISAIEAHGTGTSLGDPIEFQALNQVFKPFLKKKCAVGSVKGNLGHLECAAGIASFIKMVLCLKNKYLVPSVNFKKANSYLEIDDSPFYINVHLKEWLRQGNIPLRAGVSAFGIGGTNAHVILEEYENKKQTNGNCRPIQLITLSAKTETALANTAKELAAFLEGNNSDILSDVAYTQKVGRSVFTFRLATICENRDNAIALLRNMSPDQVWKGKSNSQPKIVFMFPGQGSQYINMARDIYKFEPIFRYWFDYCSQGLKQYLNEDLKELVFVEEPSESTLINHTKIVQPLLFAIEYALAQLWMHWRVKPQGMIGHSIGEYVAACLAGVFSLDDALFVVANRAILMNGVEPGTMCAVALSEEDIAQYLNKGLSLAAINAPKLTVVSGIQSQIQKLVQNLDKAKINYRMLHTSHAFHSEMMSIIAQPFLDIIKKVKLLPPAIPYFSNVSGEWITTGLACNPEYWVKHLLSTVKFSQSIKMTLKEGYNLFLEIGPGTTLNSLVKMHEPQAHVISSLPHAKDQRSSLESLITALGKLWLASVPINWNKFYENESRQKIRLPGYPFEKKRYWIEAVTNCQTNNWHFELSNDSQDDVTEVYDEAITTDRPGDPIIKEIGAIFKSVLGIERVSIKDNFFELGGHSLIATQLVNLLFKAFKVKIQLSDFFKNPTVEGVYDLIAAPGDASPAEVENYQLPQVIPDLGNRYEPFPLTEMQQAQWLGRISAFSISNVAAHVYYETEKEGLDLERLNHSWQIMIERHEMLRTILSPNGTQTILENPPLYLIRNMDLRNEQSEVINGKLLQIRSEMDHMVRDVDKWPLFEVRTTQLPGNIVRIHFSIDLLICDIASLRILTHEWALVYQKPELDLPKLELSFRDYVLTEKLIKQTSRYKESNQYWDQRVTELPYMPQLPLTKNPNSLTKPVYKRLSMKVDQEKWQQIKAYGASRKISPSIVLLTAFSLVLGKWSKEPRFCVNTTIINRMPIHPQVQEIVGEFASFAPVEVDITRNDSFEELAEKLQKRNLENLEHRYVSGTSILRKIAQHRGEGLGAVLPIVFTSTIVHEVEGEIETRQVLGKYVYIISQTPQVWLDHAVLEDEDGLILSWHYIEQLFPEGMIETMWAIYKKLIDGLLIEANWITAFSQHLMPKEQLLKREAINNTTAPVKYSLLHEPFLKLPLSVKKQIAIVAGEREIMYEELAVWSCRLSGKLRQIGVRPEKLVAVVMEKGWEQVVAVMGILQSGGAYLPIAADLPSERLGYIIENAGVDLILTQAHLSESLNWPQATQRLIISEAALNNIEPDNQELVPEQHNLAYVIYTSGSTGMPKGVMIEHFAAVNTISDINTRFGVGINDRILALSELNFDLSVYDIFGMLAAGGTIVIPDNRGLKDPQHWLKLIVENRITIWNSVPALMEMFVEYLENNPQPIDLRLVLLSGDWIPLHLPQRLERLIPGIKVISLGGATEASIWSIIYPINQLEPEWISIPYGKPLNNQQFYVLNPNLEDCPVMVPGELYIGGVGVARGYLNNPELTVKSFIIHPQTGERLYRTGDLGRYMEDGNIEFLGREDFQVKISGFRIELGEIEAVLNQYPDVKAAMVDTYGKQQEKRSLVGYIILKPEKTLDTNQLQQFLSTKLPNYMIPSHFVVMEQFPLSGNGKIDRKLLPDPFKGANQSRMTESSSPLVKKLVAIFAEVIGIDPANVDIDANFFTMGGDSIMGIQIITKASKEGLEIAPSVLFENPTISALASILADKYQSVFLDKTQNQFNGIVPLTPVQKELFDRAGYAVKNYNLSLLVETETDINPENLEKAFQNCVSRNDVLQLHYIWGNEGWVQRYNEKSTLAQLDFTDVTGMTQSEINEVINNTRDELGHLMEPSDSPLLKLCLFYNSEQSSNLLIIANQLIFDCRSLNLFIDFLFEEYQNLMNGSQTPGITQQLTFKNWVTRLSSLINPASMGGNEIGLWGGLPKERLGFNLGIPNNINGAENTCVQTTFDKNIIAHMWDAVLNITKTSIEEFFLVALASAFAKTNLGNELYLDWLVQPSESELKPLKFEKTLGNLSWLYPVYLKNKPEEKPELAVKRFKEQIRSHPDLGINYGMLHDSQMLEMHARSDIKFSVHSFGNAHQPGCKKVETTSEFKNKLSKQYLLEIDVFIHRENVNVYWNYNCSYFPAEVIERLIEAFINEVYWLTNYFISYNKVILSPSDFKYAEIDQTDLDKILGKIII